MSTITPLKAWLRQATAAEQELLAERVGTSRQYLFHVSANEDKAYKREPKPALAAAIERETRVMAKASKGRLPVVWRTDLVTACRECEFARKCLGDTVTASHFPIVTAKDVGDGVAGD